MQKILAKPYLFWSFVGALVYIPFLGASHLFDWDEINFAESAREMLVSRDFLSVQINFLPFWEKPPLFMWLQVLSFQLFGTFTDSAWTSMEFAARFPNALIGFATLLSLFTIGKKHVSATFGHLWAFSYLAAITPHVYASSGIIDPLFNLLIFLGVYAFSEFYGKPTNKKWLYFAGISLGLALLTKGPVALLLWGLCCVVIGIWERKRVWSTFSTLFRGALTVGIIACLFFIVWYGLIVWTFGFGIIKDFFAYQMRLVTTGDAGHGQPFYYHALVLLLGCFPISIWAGGRILGLKQKAVDAPELSRWMLILFWVVLILFSLVKTKIVHYSSMCWIPLSYFSAQVVYEWLEARWVWTRVHSIFFAIVGLIFGLILTAVPLIGMYASVLSTHIKDAFVRANLQAPIYWAGWEWVIGLAFIVLTVWFIVGKITPRRLFTTMGLYVCLIMGFLSYVVPKIEGYTQATAIDFYTAHQGQNVYIETLGFKSYAHLLYFQKQSASPSGDVLLNQQVVDRPTYFVMKSVAEDKLKYHPNLIRIKEENGFLFYKHK